MADLQQENWTKQLSEDNNSVVLDVRTQEEVEELGIIPDALHIDIYKGQGFIYEVEQLDKSKNYYVYCKAGGRSAQACAIMNQLGFENTYNLLGGFTEWKGDINQLK
ncbi:rhodanese-like domain-containing protein [Winogradskyella jejuensis]|uniref:Rhodanese-related sulfurtransferase n=1 Tax=Winogradskyella jejuensis TaxID=1089305 RepID=A0A1M5KDM1_9FLAO|nr:rhodanese-like domain-containing protein [Winogradskyella jejuensis]SHG50801.1 Rhodanese-related sulfurtransferase [Winogradskyella jejuensis]